MNTSLRISGRSEKNDFAITLSQTKQESALTKNGALERTNFTSNTGTELFKGFKLRSSTQLIYQRNDFNPYFTSGGGTQLFSALNSSPFYDFEWKDAAGNYAYLLPAGVISVNGRNPNYYFQYSTGKDQTVSVIQSIAASYRVNKYLDLESKYGINYEKQDISQIYYNQSQNINIIGRNSSGIGGFSSNKGGIANYSYTTTFQNAL